MQLNPPTPSCERRSVSDSKPQAITGTIIPVASDTYHTSSSISTEAQITVIKVDATVISLKANWTDAKPLIHQVLW